MRRIVQSPAPPSPGSVRPRYVLIGMGLSLLAAVLATSPVEKLIAQAGMMVPGADEQSMRRARRAQERAIGLEPQLVAVERALWEARRGESGFGQAERSDPDNGLYAHLRLLPDLKAAETRGHRSADGRAAGSRPTEGAGLAAGVRKLASAAPVRLYLGRRRELALEAHQSIELPDRLAARGADGSLTYYGLLYRPVLRELADGLLAQGRAWREAGRPADAVAADVAVVRLMVNLVQESPWPGVVLLAVEYIPAALCEIAGEAGSAGLPADVVERSLAVASKVECLRAEWDRCSPGDATNLLPQTGDIVLARDAHDGVVGSMLACGYALGTWLALGLICAVLLPFAVSSWRAGVWARWRWRGWGRLIGAGMITAPLIVAALVFLIGRLPLAWLISMPSVAGFLLPVLLVPVLVGLAARVCIELPEAQAGARIPWRAALIMAGVALVILAGMALLPVRASAGHPPVGVQLFRRLGTLVGLESSGLMAVWTIWGLIRRRRLKMGRGSLAGAALAVAAWAWLATAIIGLAVLEVNARNDALHEKAFIAAAAEPMKDRLGPAWRDQYFKGVPELLGRIAAGGSKNVY